MLTLIEIAQLYRPTTLADARRILKAKRAAWSNIEAELLLSIAKGLS